MLTEGLLSQRHETRDGPDGQSLFSFRGEAVTLRSSFPVRGQHVEPDPGSQSGFSVLPGDLDVNGPEPSIALIIDPAEDRRQDETLPRLELKIAALPAPLDMWQALNEIADRFGPIDIEPVREVELRGVEFL